MATREMEELFDAHLAAHRAWSADRGNKNLALAAAQADLAFVNSERQNCLLRGYERVGAEVAARHIRDDIAAAEAAVREAERLAAPK